jgi:hypothetical protein
MANSTVRKPTPGIRERSPGHYELRAYNAAAGKHDVRTDVHPGRRKESGAGIREAKREHVQLVSDIRAGKYGVKVTPIYDSLLKDGMTRANLVHHHRVLRAALNQAMKWNMVPENPANDVDLESAAAPEMNVPTIQQGGSQEGATQSQWAQDDTKL